MITPASQTVVDETFHQKDVKVGGGGGGGVEPSVSCFLDTNKDKDTNEN